MAVIKKRLVTVKAGETPSVLEWNQEMDMEITITKTIDKKSNKAEVKVYNLSPSSIAFLGNTNIDVQVLAGEEITGALFLGKSIKKGIKTVELMPGNLTTIVASEGKYVYENSNIFSASYPPGTSRNQILSDILAQKGIKRGYIDSRIADKTFIGPSAFFQPVRMVLDSLFEDEVWSLNNNTFNLNTVEDRQEGDSLLIDGDALYGPPVLNDVGLVVKTALWAAAACGKGFEMDTKDIKGLYRVEKLVHNIHSTGLVWSTTLTGKKI